MQVIITHAAVLLLCLTQLSKAARHEKTQAIVHSGLRPYDKALNKHLPSLNKKQSSRLNVLPIKVHANEPLAETRLVRRSSQPDKSKGSKSTSGSPDVCHRQIRWGIPIKDLEKGLKDGDPVARNVEKWINQFPEEYPKTKSKPSWEMISGAEVLHHIDDPYTEHSSFNPPVSPLYVTYVKKSGH